MRYNKCDMDIDKARGELDKNKRIQTYHEIQKKLMEDLPAIPLFMMHYPTAYRSHLTGLPERDPGWGIDFYHIRFIETK
jgi:ABC-type transport system substrate-binding protein